MRLQKIIYRAVLFVLVISVDQAIKSIAPFFVPVFQNPGVAFGLLSPLAVYLILFSLAILIWVFWKEKVGYSEVLFLAGVASNIIDRLRYHAVLDYIDIKIIPVFNLADVAVIVGLFFMLLKFTGLQKTKR